MTLRGGGMTGLGSIAGSLRARLVIETPSYPPDGAGGAGRTWSFAGEVWADIRPSGGTQHVLQDAQGQRVTHRIRIRWRANLTSEARFRQGARTLKITAVFDPDGRRRFLDCLATEDMP